MKMSRLAISASSTLVNNSCESVSRDHAGSDPNVTLTTAGPVVSDSPGSQSAAAMAHSHDDIGDGDRRRQPMRDRKPRDVDALTPRLMSPGEESEGITPTASFCCQGSTHASSADVSQSELAEKEFQPEDLARKSSNGSHVITSTPKRPQTDRTDPEKEVGQSEDVSRQSDETVTGHNDWTLKDLEDQRPKSTSPRNGMHKFYIGEEKENEVRKTLSDGPVSHAAVSPSHNDTSEHAEGNVLASDDIMNEQASSSVEEEKNLHNGIAPGGEVVSDKTKHGSTTGEQSVQDDPKNCPSWDDKGLQCQRQASESAVEFSSSEGSIIMQVWDAITRPRKGHQCLSDSQPTSQTPSSQSGQQDGSDPQPTSQTPSSQSGQQNGSDPQPTSQTPSFQSGQQDGSDSPATMAKLKTSKGSSLTSSVDSRHSESDDVFQDANDDVSNSNTDGTSTAAATAMEESPYESGQYGNVHILHK